MTLAKAFNIVEYLLSYESRKKTEQMELKEKKTEEAKLLAKRLRGE